MPLTEVTLKLSHEELLVLLTLHYKGWKDSPARKAAISWRTLNVSSAGNHLYVDLGPEDPGS